MRQCVPNFIMHIVTPPPEADYDRTSFAAVPLVGKLHSLHAVPAQGKMKETLGRTARPYEATRNQVIAGSNLAGPVVGSRRQRFD
jgi:hypothetical protein